MAAWYVHGMRNTARSISGRADRARGGGSTHNAIIHNAVIHNAIIHTQSYTPTCTCMQRPQPKDGGGRGAAAAVGPGFVRPPS